MNLHTVFLFVSFSFLVAAGESDIFRDADAAFKQFKQDHGKSYKNVAEESKRREHFRKNYKKIQDCNNGQGTSICGVNERSDWSDEESNITRGTRVPAKASGRVAVVNDESITDRLASKIDWRTDICMTPVKNQGQCGSCWAFSANNPLEFITCRANGNVSISLSEQNLVDCSGGYGNAGCNGGFYSDAWDYVKAMGLAKTSSYAYTAKDETCKYSTSMNSARVSSYTALSSVTAMMTALSNGPISAALNSNTTAFEFYSSGILAPACTTDVDHAIDIVGYDVVNGKNVWIIRNSWGTTWGMNGYAYITRGNNMCGIEDFAYSVSR